MILFGPQPLMGWSESHPYPKSPPNSTLGSLKAMGGTSRGLPFTFEASLEKYFYPLINRGPFYARRRHNLSIVMLFNLSLRSHISPTTL